ncbi:MAG: aromatic acid decarboxylase [Candidatus Altiarchaeales archaeon]|nr:MAG: aromatic acid decarboxylase [Candidatus Altiarchaeales archaeon]
MSVIIAITGASGIVLAERLIEELSKIKNIEIYTIISKNAENIMNYETFDIEKVRRLSGYIYREDELDAEISSSSFIADAMVIVPCSMKTLSSIANGFSDNLITRVAENILKLNKKLVVVPRDTPLSLNAIENMRKLKLQNALILPPNMAYYYKPKTVDDVTNFFVGKILDALGIENKLYERWKCQGFD